MKLYYLMIYAILYFSTSCWLVQSQGKKIIYYLFKSMMMVLYGRIYMLLIQCLGFDSESCSKFSKKEYDSKNIKVGGIVGGCKNDDVGSN